jgi:hypothetical protein
MAKVKVTTRFKDILNPARIYKVGQEVEFVDNERVKDLVSRGLVEVIGKLNDEPKVEAAETKKAEVASTPKPKGRPKTNTTE